MTESDPLKGWPIDLRSLYGRRRWANRKTFHMEDQVFEVPGQDACILLYYIGEISLAGSVGALAVFKDKARPRKVYDAGGALFWFLGDKTVQWAPEGGVAFLYQCKITKSWANPNPGRLDSVLHVLDIGRERVARCQPTGGLYDLRPAGAGRFEFVDAWGRSPPPPPLELSRCAWKDFRFRGLKVPDARLFELIAVLLAAAGLACVLWRGARRPEPPPPKPVPSAQSGVLNKMMDFTLPDTSGKPRRLSELTAGKHSLVYLYSPMCGHCDGQLPRFSGMARRLSAKHVAVVGVQYYGSPQSAGQAQRQFELPGTLLADAGGEVCGRLGVGEFTVFSLDPSGKVLYRGGVEDDALLAAAFEPVEPR